MIKNKTEVYSATKSFEQGLNWHSMTTKILNSYTQFNKPAVELVNSDIDNDVSNNRVQPRSDESMMDDFFEPNFSLYTDQICEGKTVA